MASGFSRSSSPASTSSKEPAGTRILAISRAPGAAMKQAAIRYSNSAPIWFRPTSTEPATVERPPTITAKSSDLVMPAT